MIQISHNFWAKYRNPGHSEGRHSFEKNKKTETYRYYHERTGLEMMFTNFLIASFGRLRGPRNSFSCFLFCFDNI
jgi:hypothetical protein